MKTKLGVGSVLFLSIVGWAQPTRPAKLLIFKGKAPNGSALHLRLQQSGHKFRRLHHTGMILIQSTSPQAEESLKKDPELRFLEEDRRWHATGMPSTNNPDTDSWVSDFYEADGASPLSNPPSSSVVLALVDSGLRYENPFFQGALDINAQEANGKPGVDNDGDGFIYDVYGASMVTKDGHVDTDGSVHGTHVASLAKIAIDQAGASNAVKLLPVSFMDNGESGSTSAALLALEYAANRGAKVVNLSWGGAGPQAYSQALYEALVQLYQDDIVVVAAAGNSTNDNDTYPFFPSSYNLPNLISVASATPNYDPSGNYMGLSLSYFSNFGRQSVDVAAPGDSMFSGSEIGLLGANGGPDYQTNPTVRMQGTSMAAPVVSGVAAVMRSINPSLHAAQIRQILIDSSKQMPELNGAVVANGLVDPQRAYQMAEQAGAQDNPSVPGNSVRGSQAGDETQGMIGGCAQIWTVHGGPPDGPFGGNSLGLCLVAYVLSRLASFRTNRLRKSQTYA